MMKLKDNENTENVKDPNAKSHLFAHIPTWTKVVGNIFMFIIAIFALIAAILACIYIRTPVIGPSMQPTINTYWTETNNLQDTVMINRLQKGERGDIIVIDRSNEIKKDYVIKRLIATGGDYVSVVPILDSMNKPTGKYKILIIKKGESTPTEFNDGITDMLSTYIKFNDLKNKEGLTFKTFGAYDYLYIEEDKVFYLGDNRNESQDCSEYGPIEKKKIVGKVVLIINHNKNTFKECFKYFWNSIF